MEESKTKSITESIMQSENNELVRDEHYEARMDSIQKKNYLRILILSLYGIMFGYYLPIFNPLGDPLLRDVYKLDPKEIPRVIGNINMLFSIGCLFSVLCSGPISEKIGRRKLIMVLDVCNVFIISMYWFENIYLLQVARFLSGLSSAGLGMVSSILITESLPKSICGVANSLLFAISTVFACFAYFQQTIFSRDQIVRNWQFILCWPIIPGLLKAVCLPLIVNSESPKYHVSRFADHPEVSEKVREVYQETHRTSQVHHLSDITIRVHLEERLAARSASRGFSILCSPLMRRRFLTGIVVISFNQLCGTTFFSIYSTDLFNRISGNGKQVTTALAVMKVVSAFIGVFCMKSFGRKVNLMFGILVQGLSLSLILASMNYKVPLLGYVGVGTFMIGFAVGIGGAFQAYLTEILPPKGASICNAMLWAANSLIVKLLPIVSGLYGDEMILFGFAGLNFIGFFILERVLIETKNKTEDVIIEEFKSRKLRFLDFK